MPRFENEDFDPKKRNREDIDRTVPKDEDYYNYSPEDIDLNFNSKKREDNIVVDNQRKPGNYGDYQQDSRGDITFKSETIDDFDRGSEVPDRTGSAGRRAVEGTHAHAFFCVMRIAQTGGKD